MFFGIIGVVLVVTVALAVFYFLQESIVEETRDGVVSPIWITSSDEAQKTLDEVSLDISGAKGLLEEIDSALSNTNS